MNTGNKHESKSTEESDSWTKKIEITWEGRQIGVEEDGGDSGAYNLVEMSHYAFPFLSSAKRLEVI